MTTRLEAPAGELMLVTAKSADADPVYTVSRGYQNTTKEDQGTGTVLLKDPKFIRKTVTQWVKNAINGIMNSEFPYWETAEMNTVTGGGYISLPEDTIRVLRVRHLGVLDNRIADIGGWQFEEMPTASVPTGRALRVPSNVTVDDGLIVDYVLPYTFSDSTEAGTVDLPIAAADIPAMWASAYGMARREVSRAELDRIEEWNQEQAIRAGVNLRMIRDAWGEVYRRVDEAKKLYNVPKHRPYRKMPEIW